MKAWRNGSNGRRGGSALIVALWVLLTLSLLIASFAFDMYVEAQITSFYRRRMKAQVLAQGGVELARFMLIEGASQSAEAVEDIEDLEGLERDIAETVERLKYGGMARLVNELDTGEVVLLIRPEESRWNVNMLEEEQWEMLLDQTGVPAERWDELMDAFFDYTDENDLHRLNGAESDDEFYDDAGYPVKNGPLDTVEELLLIKGFDDEVVFGTPPGREPADGENILLGLAQHLSTFSEGCISPNSANFETLMTLGMFEDQALAIIEHRRGLDGIEGTEDDELFENIDEVIDISGVEEDISEQLCIQEVTYFRVTSTGTAGEENPVSSVIACVMRAEDGDVRVSSWREEVLP